MKPISKGQRLAVYAGSGAAIGAGLGLLFGLMLFENMPALTIGGVLVGLLIGLIYGTQASSPDEGG